MLKKVLLLLLIFVILGACSKTEIVDFEGKSDNWKVIYTVEILDEQREHTKAKIEYIGEKPIPSGEISYVIKTDSGKMAGNTPLDDKGVIELGGNKQSCSECTFIVDESEIIKVTICWKENSEELKLNNDNLNDIDDL
ncbi:hypothetical protein [Virgibacillus dokdonensis]|uniref:hypothetical protein n=1 Tax=Virgibacillus dokdonensis TaxID=302167 RepID=UPI00098B1966|nr:hypothetical protein [Virgibacillus dokdonensis]